MIAGFTIVGLGIGFIVKEIVDISRENRNK